MSVVALHAMSSGYYSTQGITASTNVRDVSDMLDLWAHEDTPFLNRLSWGADSGGLQIEWLSENLGVGYFESLAAITSASISFSGLYDVTGGATLSATSKAGIQKGAALYFYNATDNEGAIVLVSSLVADSIYFEYVTATSTSIAASTKFYLLGNFANEGSDPFRDMSRLRTILSNEFTILRGDINITGSQAATDMYAVSDELRHQIRLRLVEMQRHREMTALYSYTQARSTTMAGMMNGCYGFLTGQSGTHIDITTTTFTEASFNTVVAECWENRGNPNVFVASPTIIRKFTGWDRSRVRTTPDSQIGGFYVSRYLTDIGIEIELVPMRKVPLNLAFVLDTSKIKLRAKKGRKAILEKLGKTGDYEMWQLISEFSMEMRGYTFGQHGMFSALTG
jgi:hypothetical protein